MPKFYCVGDDEGFGVSIDNLEATVVGESGANVETVSAPEGPRCSLVRFVVDDDGATAGTNGRCIKVEGRLVVVFPGGHGRGDG